MLKNVFEYFISKIKKEPFKLDSSISLADMGNIILLRITMFIRGKLIFKSSKTIFIDSNTTILFKNKIKINGLLTIGKDCFINALSHNGIILGSNVNIGRGTAIECSGSLKNLGKGLVIGNNVGFSTNCFLGCAGGIEIGNDTIIGNFVTMHSENHNYSSSSKLIREQGVNRQGIKIGQNCWIGAKVTILDGVHIEKGCIIAAGSVVTVGSYKENSIYAGVPAKFIKSRINDEN